MSHPSVSSGRERASTAATPAFAETISRRPWRLMHAATPCLTSSRRDTSPTTAAQSSSLAVRSSASLSKSRTTTCAPSATKPAATARPIPWAPPVTSTDLSLKRIMRWAIGSRRLARAPGDRPRERERENTPLVTSRKQTNSRPVLLQIYRSSSQIVIGIGFKGSQSRSEDGAAGRRPWIRSGAPPHMQQRASSNWRLSETGMPIAATWSG